MVDRIDGVWGKEDAIWLFVTVSWANDIDQIAPYVTSKLNSPVSYREEDSIQTLTGFFASLRPAFSKDCDWP
jgi:hypothetical protein